MGYDENTTMYEILFANKKQNLIKADSKDPIKLDLITLKHSEILEM